jgi:hypothetical protein
MGVRGPFILTEKTRQRYINREGSCKCRDCETDLIEGDNVISKIVSTLKGESTRFLYHSKCGKERWII